MSDPLPNATGESKMGTRPDREFVSVVLPIRNEKKYIERCLRALLGQSVPRGID